MNYSGSYRKLLGGAKAAMIAAIEIYNKPTFQYRDECTVILLMNAWELALKALLSKNKRSIFYPKKKGQPYKTLSWQDAFSGAQDLFPRDLSPLPIRLNLELLGGYRNNAIHFYNTQDLSVVVYSLAQTSIMNFRDLLRHSFDTRFENEITWALLPIGIRPPIDVVSYLSSATDPLKSTVARALFAELKKAVEELDTANEDTSRLLTVFQVKLESIKKIGEADALIGIESEEDGSGGTGIIRTQDPNNSHPLRQMDILERIDVLHGKRFTSYTFQAIVWRYGIRERRQYCWRAAEGVLTRYSAEVVAFVRNLSEADVTAALKDYGTHRRRGGAKSGPVKAV